MTQVLTEAKDQNWLGFIDAAKIVAHNIEGKAWAENPYAGRPPFYLVCKSMLGRMPSWFGVHLQFEKSPSKRYFAVVANEKSAAGAASKMYLAAASALLASCANELDHAIRCVGSGDQVLPSSDWPRGFWNEHLREIVFSGNLPLGHGRTAKLLISTSWLQKHLRSNREKQRKNATATSAITTPVSDSKHSQSSNKRGRSTDRKIDPDAMYVTWEAAIKIGVEAGTLETWRAGVPGHGPAFHRPRPRFVRYKGSDLLEWLSATSLSSGRQSGQN